MCIRDSFRVHFVQGGIERRRLPASRRPGDQHHAIGRRDGAAEPVQIVFLQPQRVEVQAVPFRGKFFLGENTNNDRFPEGAGDDGCLLYTSPSPRDRTRSRMPSSA